MFQGASHQRNTTSAGRWFWAVLTIALTAWLHAAQGNTAPPLITEVLYLREPIQTPPRLSSREQPPDDLGVKGAQLGVTDNNTTGRFLGHQYRLIVETVASTSQAVEVANRWLAEGSGLTLVDLPSTTLEAVLTNTPINTKGVLINVSNPDDRWRVTDCTPRLLHTTPSRAMLADALGQFLTAKRWRDWLLVRGAREDDQAFAQALARAAKRFGADIVDEREWTFKTDLRRNARDELPLFTQASAYDVVVVADEIGDVGEFIPYNTWLPRPVVGTQGLTPTPWSPVLEQWGALQLQQRFERLAERPMLSGDYSSWLALRSLGEAVTRINNNDPEKLLQYLLSEDFAVAAFVGRSLTFRSWNGQIRQPIALVTPTARIDQSPQPGFLHPVTELDTLGFDRPEVSCPFNGESE